MAIFLDLPFWRTAIRGLGAILCNWIYNLIAWLYQLFITISRLNILSSDDVAPIYQRVAMILTIVMTFYITFEFVKYLMQPDTLTDKEKGVGNILLRMVVTVVLIAFVPRIFSIAYKAQNIIIENQVISKVILGKKSVDFATIGNDFSTDVLEGFYRVDDTACQSGCSEEKKIVEGNLQNLRQGKELNLTAGIENSSKVDGEKVPTIKFDGIMAIVVGVFILYVLALYSIDVGVRYFQLLFLQIIAPISIIGYILPKKDGIFQKWYKQCLSTYVDLFIRLAIIYFVLLLIQVLGDANKAGTLFAGMNVSGSIKTFTYIVLVLGLLAFAQRAPKLLGDLLPKGSAAGIGFGLGAKDRLDSITKSGKGVYGGLTAPVGAARRVAGGVGGFVAGGVAGRSLKGALAGAKTGADKKSKGLVGGSVVSRTKQAAFAGGAIREKREDIKNDGGTVFGAEHMAGHYKNIAQEQDRRKANMEAYSKAKSAAESGVKEIKFMKQLEAAKSIAQADGNGTAVSMIESKMSDMKKLALRYAAGETGAEAILRQHLDSIQQAVGRDATGNFKVNFDTEANDKVKWGNIKVSIEQAAGIAKEVVKEQYTKPDGTKEAIFKNADISSLDHNNGSIVKDANGNTDYAAFAKEMGKIEDSLKNATTTLTNSDEYQKAHANAKGADNK